MKKRHYLREKRKLEAEQAQLEASLEKVKRKLEALELVWTEVFHRGTAECEPVAEEEEQTVEIDATLPVPEAVGANGHTGEWVEAAVQQLQGTFGVKEVLARIHEDHPGVDVNRSTVFGKLAKLVHANRLVIEQDGRGRRPSTFRRVSA